jgi:hypothetical protein
MTPNLCPSKHVMLGLSFPDETEKNSGRLGMYFPRG